MNSFRLHINQGARSYFIKYAFGLLFYMSLVSGGLIPLWHDGYEKVIVKAFILFGLILVLPWNVRYWKGKGVLLIYGSISAVLLLISMLKSNNILYALDKFDGVIFGTIISAAFLIMLLVRFGIADGLRSIVHVGAVILLMTVLYKLHFGFFDRSVRYFLNGPIVFGWLMGMLSLMSIHLVFLKRGLGYTLFSVVFVSAVIWSGSKGALIALIASLAVLLMPYMRYARLAVPIVLAFLFLMLSHRVFLDWISYSFPDSRLLGLVRLLEGSVTDVDQGSINIRQYLFDDGLAAFLANPLFGIGLGNFSDYSFLGFIYPHNIHLEVFLECGIFVGIIYLVFLVKSIIAAPRFSQTIAIYFLVAGFFSGDIGYLRYSFVFILVGLIVTRVPKVARGQEFST